MLSLSVDRHTLASISIAGSCLDVLGALYLAYDLLGGEHGPLRTLTRAVTYGLLFGVGYGLPLGFIFGLASGVAHGITLAWEYSRASRNDPEPGFTVDLAMSAIRGAGFALGAWYVFGATFGVSFGLLSTAGQVFSYRIGFRPTTNYRATMRPKISRLQVFAIANRTVGYAVGGYLSSLIAHHRDQAIAIGLKAGLVIGVVTAVAIGLTPFIEWQADHVPEKRMGVLGIGLMLAGFSLQSAQYWAVVLDVTVR